MRQVSLVAWGRPEGSEGVKGLATLECSTDARTLWTSNGAEVYLQAGLLHLSWPTLILRLDQQGADAALQAALARVRAGDPSTSELVIDREGGEDAVRCVVIPLHGPDAGGEPMQPSAALLLQRSDAPVTV